ncbi:class I SAM-dependent methyltransferase [Paradesertivirga mongoliensis]|uniref:Class I SAM-dependent methyltransferase n=1 Tax=Paradesertivirga mongoliensis TaxID=2100740 RepID=A0ABW4ZG77_9SPHI|nr:methyltransferase domain-containing protein [Pedobacter mongoliensis]
MSEYKDYGYNNTEATHAHAYIFDKTVAMLDKDKNKFILDLGCGNGSLANSLMQKGFNVYGTDASEKGIALAKQLNPGRFAIQDLSSDDLPEPLINIPFDTIISTEVIEHLYDPRKFIEFAKRTLLKNGGGDLILSTPYHGYWKYLALALTGKMDAHLGPLWDGGHIKFWSRQSLTALLEEKGFRVTDFKGCGRLPYLWMSMIIKARI